MKSLILTLALVALSAMPVLAGHGQQFRQQVVVQRVRVQQVRVPRQRVVVQQVVVPHHVQQFRVQRFVQPVYGVQQFNNGYSQQFNAGCHSGGLQFNAGGCQQFFAH
jgi:hypothetical protein